MIGDNVGVTLREQRRFVCGLCGVLETGMVSGPLLKLGVGVLVAGMASGAAVSLSLSLPTRSSGLCDLYLSRQGMFT